MVRRYYLHYRLKKDSKGAVKLDRGKLVFSFPHSFVFTGTLARYKDELIGYGYGFQSRIV